MIKNLCCVAKIAQAAAAGVLIALSSSAWASTDKPLPAVPENEQAIVERFKAADKNGDGKITREEAEASMPRVAMAWEKIDVDNKGYITLDQLLLIAAVNGR